MNRILPSACALLIMVSATHAQMATEPAVVQGGWGDAGGKQTQTARDAAALTQLLKEFLEGASRNDPAVHERFWAHDLIYTRSAGVRVGKADIMQGLRAAPPPKPEDPKTSYTAEDIRIQQYGDTAVVAFRLVGTTERSGQTEVINYLNTGTFLKRKGTWQVVSWQSTRIPRPEDKCKP